MTQDSDPPPSPAPHSGRTFAVDLLLGGAAVLISAISVMVAVSANRTQERLLAASTWPSLQFGSSNLDDELQPEISLGLSNAGVGPARIKSVAMFYAGKPQDSMSELLATCCRKPESLDPQQKDQPTVTITSSVDAVLKAGAEVKLLRLRKADNPLWLWERLNSERWKVSLQVCYCSVLNDCWWFDSALPDAEPPVVEACPTPVATKADSK